MANPLTIYLILCVALCATAAAAAQRSPFHDAVAAWHMGGLTDSAGQGSRLVASGSVEVGVALAGAEREASLERGGDGRVARFRGGWLSAGQGADGELNLKGSAMTLCVRLRDPSGAWRTPLFAKHGGHGKLVYNLFSHNVRTAMDLGFELGTDASRGMFQVSVPVALIGPRAWHDVVCRYDGAKLQLFVDGVCLDEAFPTGSLRQGNAEPCLIGAESHGGVPKAGFHGLIDHTALWSRALSDAEVAALSGGEREAARRRNQWFAPPGSTMQYYKPPNQFWVGDCLPFFHDGTLRFLYLLDRNHHRSKGGLGAHQWAQAATTDLIHWTHHPLAIPISEPREGSICTGSAFWHGGVTYGFYATRMLDRTQHLSVATSTDGIHFNKSEPNPFASPPKGYDPRHYRDPTVFQDPATGLFHMLVTASLTDRRGGCLAHLISTDLKSWKPEEPFLVTGDVPECPDHFAWNGWYYLVFSTRGLARYRMSRHPLGPWQRPKVDVFGSAMERVAKTAAFAGNRRLSASFLALAGGGYAGHAVFRELVQNPDGTLGTKFPAELIPKTGDALSGHERSIRVNAGPGSGSAMLSDVPQNIRLTLRVTPGPKAASFGLRLRASPDGQGGRELRCTPPKRQVSLGAKGPALAQVDGLDRPFVLDIILCGDILDVCIGDRRTLIDRLAERGKAVVFFAEDADVTFDRILVRPLQEANR